MNWGVIHIILALLFVTCSIRAQNAIRIGEWREHLPYNRGNTVTQDEDRVYYGADQALVAIEKDSTEVRFFSKIDGLNDVGITTVKYEPTKDVLIVVYSNSNIDLVYSDRIVNVNDIATNNTIVGSKIINNVYTDEAGIVYFSCDFGLVEFDLNTLKFGFTMFTGTPVQAYTKFNGAYWLAADEGVFSFDKFDSELVSNFNAWDLAGSEVGLPEDYEAQDVVTYQDMLFVAAGNSLYHFDNGEFLFWDEKDENFIEFVSADGALLMVGYRCFDDICNGSIDFYNSSGKLGDDGFNCTSRPTFAIQDQFGAVWYADEFDGIRRATDWRFGCEFIEINAPYSSNVSEIAVSNNIVFVAAGGVTDNYNNLRRADGFFMLNEGKWSSFNRKNTEILGEKDILDYFRIEPHPNPDTPVVFIGSYYAGLVKYNWLDSTFSFYDQDNSALQGAVGDPLRERVAGLAFDDNGNLWMTCYLAPNPLVVMKEDGTWHNFSTRSSTRLGEVIIDQRGYKWCAVISPSEGILVYDDNGTIDNTADDRQRVFTTSNSNLPTNTLTNLTMDRSGDIWVGTDMGPVVFDGGLDPFEGNDQGYRVIVEQDGVLSFLLGEEEITTIAIDGANQKWIGTQNGVFVQSANGEIEIATFNIDNSPLLDNSIIDIAINQEDGEVFIGTQAGIVSTRGEAIEGRPVHDQDAYAFPNPVSPDYEGPIAIRGLAENAPVKITNVAGRVVFETRAQGGQAVWSGKDLDGKRAESGVYLVFSTNEDTFNKPDALVTKILLVN